jgi:hypothetical protein
VVHCHSTGRRRRLVLGTALFLSAFSAAAAAQPVASALSQRANLPHGVAGDDKLVFVTEPLNGRVAVIVRDTGQEIGELPPPPDGFLLPFELRTRHANELIVLDAGGFPSPTALAIPRVYDYKYHYSPATRQFRATLTRSVRFDGIPIIFSEDIEVLSDGRYVVSDSGFGALWVVERDGTIVPGITPVSLAPPDAIPQLGACPFSPGPLTIDGVPFELPGSFAPGVGSMTSSDDYLYFSGTCSGGLWRVPLAVFGDERAPHERAADIELVSARPSLTDFDTLKGLTMNRWDPQDEAVYAADPFHLQILRIDTRTGSRSVVAAGPLLFNFSVSMKWLPPVAGRQSLVVSSDQEHRFAALNAALGGVSVFQFPFLITEVLFPR